MNAPSLADLLAPAGGVALVTQECQHGVIGPRSVLPALAEAARETMVPNVARLVGAARSAGVPVIHCTAERRADGRGSNTNAHLFTAVRKSRVQLLPGSREVQVLEEIGVAPSDIVIPRRHGLSPMAGTGLEPVLRNLGVRTVVGVGVSANVAIPNFVFDAVNAGYRFVLPVDAIAGVPASYTEQLIEHTLSFLATITTSDEVVAAWS